MASTLSVNLSSAAGPLSDNPSRKLHRLRAECATIASAYIYPPQYAAECHQLSVKLDTWALETGGRDQCLTIGRNTSHRHEPCSYIGFAGA